LVEQARQAGEQPPGRPTLVKLTGATDYAVRQALAELDEPAGDAGEQASDSFASEPPAPAMAPAVDALVETVDADAGEPLATAGDSAGETGEPLANPIRRASATRGGKAYSVIGFVAGAVVSVAFNVLAARIPPEHAPASWQPNLAAEVGAVVWPLFLLIAVEVISRVPWPKGWGWMLARIAGVVAVALVGAVISYQHIEAVLLTWGYNPLSAGVGPLAVDGLMVVSGFGMLAMAGGRAGASLASAGDKAGE
jgi:hypothetical protein